MLKHVPTVYFKKKYAKNRTIISLLYPIVFKFGATNGKIILFAVVFGIGGIVALVSNFIDMTSVINMINGLDNYSLIAIPIISVILLGISYLISNKIYQNKEKNGINYEKNSQKIKFWLFL